MPRGKRKTRGEGASSSQPAEPIEIPNCIDDKAVRKYRLLESQRFFPEIGFDFDEGWNPFAEIRENIRRQIEAQGWGYFVQIPRGGSGRLVLEFYANARKEERRRPESRVRGIEVRYSREVIRDVFHLPPSANRCAYARRMAANKNHSELARILCGRDVDWIPGKTGLPISIDKMNLTVEAKIWHFFINSKIFPSLNKKYVTLNRVVLISCILREERVNIADILEHGLIDNMEKPVPKLYFPFLVNELCRHAGIERDASELNVPAPPLGNVTGSWLRKITRVQRAPQEAPPEAGQRQRQRQAEQPHIYTPEQQSQLLRYMTEAHHYSVQEQLWYYEQMGLDRSRRPPPPILPPWFPGLAPEQPDDEDNDDEDEDDEDDDDADD